MVQTDNGPIFTNRFLTTNNDKLTLFEQELKKRHIRYKTIKTYTPKHNGKVERSHRCLKLPISVNSWSNRIISE